MSRLTIFASAVTCGVLVAIAAGLVAERLGFGLASAWGHGFPTNSDAVRSALGWWTIGGAGFVGSFVAFRLLADPAERRIVRVLAWLLGAALFVLLAGVEHIAPTTTPSSLVVTLAVDLATFALALATALCGGYFASGR